MLSISNAMHDMKLYRSDAERLVTRTAPIHLIDCDLEEADLRGEDIGGLRLIDATLFRGAIISRDQAGYLRSELGLTVG